MPVVLTSKMPRPSAVPLTDVALMREIGLMAIETIRTRTRLGRGLDGPLAPYSPGYARQKADEGLSSTVNLTVSGDLLNSLQITEVTDRSVTIGWTR